MYRFVDFIVISLGCLLNDFGLMFVNDFLA